jgi:uncharacterized protein YndB with AHSA1/START domain
VNTSSDHDARTVIVERLLPHPPQKVWRALTDSSLLAQWLLGNDFSPSVGKAFQFRAEATPDWNGIIDCEVLIVEPERSLSYTWNSLGLRSVVLFTLTAQDGGTHLRVEQTGFRLDQEKAFRGARYGWERFLARLQVLLTEASA